MTIDAHTHFIPQELAAWLLANPGRTNAETELKDGVYWIRKDGFYFPLVPQFYNAQTRFADMDRTRIDKGVLSVSPLLFFYETDTETCLEICRLCNDWAAGQVRMYPERYDAMAMVPMQDIDAAVSEMKRAHTELGMNAVEIAPVINGEMSDSRRLFPFYEFCEKEGIVIYLHPAMVDRRPPYDKYHAMNLVGYVQETNWALVRMIFGGVFRAFPKLKVFTSHAGGSFPYQFGRLMHGYEVREEAKADIDQAPSAYLGNIYFDTITHWPAALQFLVDNFGDDHVLMGTDYPYDMADALPVDTVESLKITADARRRILSGNWETIG